MSAYGYVAMATSLVSLMSYEYKTHSREMGVGCVKNENEVYLCKV